MNVSFVYQFGRNIIFIALASVFSQNTLLKIFYFFINWSVSIDFNINLESRIYYMLTTFSKNAKEYNQKPFFLSRASLLEL